jgi:hypothetical protein
MKSILIAKTPDDRYIRAATDQEKAGFAAKKAMSERELLSWLQGSEISSRAQERAIVELRDKGEAVIVMG